MVIHLEGVNPLRLGGHGDGDVLAAGLVRAERGRRRVVVPSSFRHLAGRGVFANAFGQQHHHALEHRDVHVSALARPLAIEERRHDS